MTKDDAWSLALELQNCITAIEHEHKNELIAALTRIRNIFFAQAKDAAM
jgi:hypothetical protein